MGKFIWMLVAFVVVIAGAVLAYNALSPTVQPPAALPAPSEQVVSQAPAESGPSPQALEEPEQPEPIPAPDFTAWDAAGNEVKLSQRFGVPIVLNFWASWCPPCKQEMPDFDEAAAQYGETLQFVMVDAVGANGETREDGESYIAQEGFAFSVWYDQEQQGLAAYGIRAFPTTLLIDGEGNVVVGWEGAVTGEILQQRIEAYLGL